MPAKGESTAISRRYLHKSFYMKNGFLLLALFCPVFILAQKKNITDTSLLQPVEIVATRASDYSPVTQTTVTKAQLEKLNYGPDLPFLLDQTPGVVVNSDAGNGVGYTGIRIRGSDASRINVSINGIPFNDAESQGTFFVDIPDIASSTGSIQVQRGVGTSTNGTGAFGASINLNTNEIKDDPAFSLNSSFGSYQTFKNTVVFNSGIFKKHFTIDGRLSYLRSDGYIDRAFSRLKSGFLSAAYITHNNSVRFNIISGKEKTYQAWNGIDALALDTNRTYNSSGTEKPGSPYSNETDNYTQSHYQLFYNHQFSPAFKTSLALFLTRGKGYYEQYKARENFSDYGLPDFQSGTDVISQSDIIRRLWLNNYFYGSTFSAEYKRNNTNLILGGSVTGYNGQHFGRIIWAQIQDAIPNDFEWYNVNAFKNDFALFGKWIQKIKGRWFTYLDLQGRLVNYKINGFRENPDLDWNNNYFFLNPKAGITYRSPKLTGYISFGKAAKEPNRDDFEAAVYEKPKAEKLYDLEAGFQIKNKAHSVGVNLYYMSYKDQLILTGKINDVGAYTRTNTPKSYRVGIEAQARATILPWFSLGGNICVSKNRVKEFSEFMDDYDNGGQIEKQYHNTPIAFSPGITGSLNLELAPIKGMTVHLVSKYVGRQYLDNSGVKERSLDSYFLENIMLSYSWKIKGTRELELFFHANNVFSKKYEANGYSYSYIYDGKLNTENYYFPMAPLNVMGGINIHL